MSEEGSGNSKFVVRDRRRFDSEGNDRADGSSERSSTAAVSAAVSPSSGTASSSGSNATSGSAMAAGGVKESSAPKAAGAQNGAPQGAGGSRPQSANPAEFRPDPRPESRPDLGPPPDTEINFSSFVISLATQALMQLGEIKPPDGMPIDVDRDGARQTIDILSVLDYKTRGNLTEEEAKLMEEVLHRLRLSYVKHNKPA